jgi:hypothetical protein
VFKVIILDRSVLEEEPLVVFKTFKCLFKGTVARDFLASVFFMDPLFMGLRF